MCIQTQDLGVFLAAKLHQFGVLSRKDEGIFHSIKHYCQQECLITYFLFNFLDPALAANAVNLKAQGAFAALKLVRQQGRLSNALPCLGSRAVRSVSLKDKILNQDSF